MHLIKPKGRKRKYDIRLRNHDGRTVKIPGDRAPDAAKRLGGRVEMLVKAKANGDPPPAELRAWIDNMPESLSTRLVKLGLLDQQRLERLKPLADHIDSYERSLLPARATPPSTRSSRQERSAGWSRSRALRASQI